MGGGLNPGYIALIVCLGLVVLIGGFFFVRWLTLFRRKKQMRQFFPEPTPVEVKDEQQPHQAINDPIHDASE